jgi:hypothetical protein
MKMPTEGRNGRVFCFNSFGWVRLSFTRFLSIHLFFGIETLKRVRERKTRNPSKERIETRTRRPGGHISLHFPQGNDGAQAGVTFHFFS